MMTAPAQRLAAMAAAGTVDVVIIGAGINGAGLFRELSLQGVACLLVDKGDFGSGTSAAPSRLIHGGLKYLETGEFRLVAQSTLERNLLLNNAPHLVIPLPTVIPIFSWGRGIWAALRTFLGSTTAPRRRGALLIKLGLTIYDYYGARHRVMPRHKMTGRRAALQDLPGLTPRIVATATYYDARVTHPERLVLELVTDALGANPRAAAVNYTRLTAVADGVLTFVQPGGGGFSVRPRVVVNAAGPWIDGVNATLGAPSRLIGGTRGSHVLLRHDELIKSLAGRMVYFEADDGRICLVYGCGGLALVGSTDIPADNPDHVRAGPAEIDYLLESLRTLLPGFSFEPGQIVYSYSGIRPLPASGAAAPGLISRDHSAPVAEPEAGRPFPIVSLVGGKWTTFRGFAEEVADRILQQLGRGRTVSTRTLAIGGGKGFPRDPADRPRWVAELASRSGITAERIDELLSRYGTSAAAIMGEADASADAVRLADSPSYSLAEIDYMVRHEFVEHLIDIVKRRTTLAISGSLTRRDLEKIAQLAGATLGWDAARAASEIAGALAELETLNGYHAA